MRGFLGLHRFTPTPALRGDMGWTSNYLKRKICMLRLYNRIVTMANHRLPKIILNWDMKSNTPGWARDVKNIMIDIEMYKQYTHQEPICLRKAKEILLTKEIVKWNESVINMDKLRTYQMFKWDFGVENYVSTLLSKRHRSFLAQFRSGILPLKIETGRFQNIPIDKRICTLCNQDSIEDEIHFLLECDFYSSERQNLFRSAEANHENFSEIENDVKLTILMNDEDLFGEVANFIANAYEKRSMALAK